MISGKRFKYRPYLHGRAFELETCYFFDIMTRNWQQKDWRKNMKKNSKWLALLLAGAMTVSPLSYVNAYAAEGDGAAYSTDATAAVQTENTETNAAVTDASAVSVSADKASAPETTGETNKTPAKEENKNSATDTNAESESNAKQKDAENESEASQKESTDKSEDKNSELNRVKESENSENQNQPETEINKETETVEKMQEDAESEIATQAAETSETPVKPTAAVTGVKVLKNDGDEYGMFPISDAVYTVKGDKIEISFNTGTKAVDRKSVV